MMPIDADYQEVLPYDIVALMDENYKDTYGDVNVDINFATMYDVTKATIILAGFETDEPEEQPYVENPELRTGLEWYVLRTWPLRISAESDDTDLIQIGLKQLNLPRMEEEPMMLIVISEPLEEIEETEETE